MPDYLTGKKLAAVQLEGTVTEGAELPTSLGTVKAGAVERLAKLREDGWYVVLFSVAANFTSTLPMAFKFLADEGLPYDEIWASHGVPPADLWVIDGAVPLFPPASTEAK